MSSTSKEFKVELKNNFREAEEQAKGLNDELGRFKKASTEANKTFDKNATFAKRYGDELEPLTTRMGEAEDRLYELALAGDKTSKEYQELLNTVAKYKKVQIETDIVVDNASKTFTQKLSGGLEASAGLFAVGTGAMALFGVESEKVEEQMLKVQSALAITQGVSTIKEATKGIGLASKATAVWNAIIALNPLALMAVALAGIITALATFTDAIDASIQKLKDFGDWIGLTNFAEDKLAKDRDDRHKAELKRIAEEKEAREKELADLKKRKVSEENILRAQGRDREARAKERKRLQKEMADALLKGEQTLANEIKATLIALDNTEKQLIADRKQRRLDASRQIQDLEINLMEEGIEKESLLNKIKFERLIEDTKTNESLTNTEKKRLIALYTQEQNETEVSLRKKHHDDLFGLESNNAVSMKDLTDQIADQEISDKKKKMDAIVGIHLKGNELIAEDERELQRKKAQMASDGFGALSDLVASFSTDNEEQAKRQFKVTKALNLAQAITNTGLAVTGALTAGGNPIKLATGAQFVEAGIAGVMGGANIARIAGTQFEGGGSSSSSSAPSTPSVSQSPNINVVGNTALDQIAQLQQQPIETFVVESKITSSQALARNREKNASL